MLADRTEVTLAPLAGNTHVCGVDYNYRVDSAWLSGIRLIFFSCMIGHTSVLHDR